jgi:hypothetical protein
VMFGAYLSVSHEPESARARLRKAQPLHTKVSWLRAGLSTASVGLPKLRSVAASTDGTHHSYGIAGEYVFRRSPLFL